MILSLDMDSEVPIYQQIRDRIVEAIASGQLVEGSSLPSTRQLAVDLGINFHTVNKAYDLLRREGLLRVNRKSGALVQRDTRSGPPEPGFTAEWETRLRTLLAEAVAHGTGDPAVLDSCRSVLSSFTSLAPSSRHANPSADQGDSAS
ncbi:GntR family transcriptional regulator [Streptomyces sp. NBC_01728]|uniref:GntR family transcriptional regulator n=1 Tax=unclassified Streptomyces TaxID=2593676 RepID=UPI00225C15CB|nr:MULTISPECIES: GntR family transcriptional regulator [unclassified Streptomyces]MCX4461382.1 GntR family transcriptional regulator [Streptomyces sp. NBC_01719]MCX4490290.1 GntR family transcriptional regulator [Streptomyces sp. NBC_01728]MCX4597084.1 GntR family transcriptional regulator [Streptomyces sp. NBC_01549]